MEIPNPPSNSFKSRENKEKNIKPVVMNTAVTKKESGFGKICKSFISEDASNIKSYIIYERLIPSIKQTILDIFTNGLEMAFFGEKGRTRGSNTASKISYRSYYDKPSILTGLRTEKVSKEGFDYENIVFKTRGDAEAVLEGMDDIVKDFDAVSVGDFYELADVSTTNYLVNKFGWTNIRSAEVIRVRDGYIIKMPKPTALN